MKYKTTIYDSDGLFKANLASLVENTITFTESINTGQGELILRLNKPFDDTTFSKNDIIEMQIFNDSNKAGFSRYTGQLTGIRRNYTADGEWIELKFAGVYYFLNNIEVTKTYEDTLTNVINQIIEDTGVSNDITNETKILGSTFLKNGVIDVTYVSYDADGEDLFSVLGNIFEEVGLDFYVDQEGYIKTESSDKFLIPGGAKGVEIEIDDDLATSITISNAIIQDYRVNYPIKLLNVSADFNLDGQIIQSIDYNDEETTINLGTNLVFPI